MQRLLEKSERSCDFERVRRGNALRCGEMLEFPGLMTSSMIVLKRLKFSSCLTSCAPRPCKRGEV